MIGAIIFDMNGPLVDAGICWHEARRIMAAEARRYMERRRSRRLGGLIDE